MIVNDNLNHRNVVSACGSQLIHIHTETAVTRNVDTNFVGLSDLRSDAGTQALTHGAESAGGQECTGFCIGIILSRPHLVLSHIRGNDGVTLCHAAQLLHHIRTG